MKLFSCFAAICFALLCCGKESLPVLQICCNSEKGIYHSGERIELTGELLNRPSNAVFLQCETLINGTVTKKETLPADKKIISTFTAGSPGWIALRVSVQDKDKKTIPNPKPLTRGYDKLFVGGIGVLVEPEKFCAAKPEPADFDAFWAKQKALLKTVPVKATCKEVADNKFKRRANAWEVEIAAPGRAPVKGYLSIPVNAKNKSLPIVVTPHGAGIFSAENQAWRQNVISFNFNAHGIENGHDGAYYQEMGRTKLRNWVWQGEGNPETWYFRDMVLRLLRALEYLKTLPEWNGRDLIMYGNSMGAAQSLWAAALDPDVSLCLALIPAFGDLSGPMPAFPGKSKRGKWLSYYDTVYFAKRIRCKTALSAGGIDYTCPPRTVFSIFNALPVKDKELTFYPNLGHIRFCEIPMGRIIDGKRGGKPLPQPIFAEKTSAKPLCFPATVEKNIPRQRTANSGQQAKNSSGIKLKNSTDINGERLPCMDKNIVFENGAEQLVFSSRNGRLQSYTVSKHQMTVPAERAFTLRFLDEKKDYIELTDADFATVEFSKNGIVWKDCRKKQGLEYHLSVKPVKGDGFRFRPQLCGLPEKWTLDFVEAIRIDVPYTDEILFPLFEGVLISEQQKAYRRIYHHDFPGDCGPGIYPGAVQMQFLFAHDGKKGLYFAADDLSHSSKILEFHAEVPQQKLALRIESSTAEAYGKTEFTLPYDLILRTCEPDWQSACETYREWVKHDPLMKTKMPHPDWLDNVFTVITYPVRGQGSISDRTNRFVPYENCYPVLEKYAEKFGTKVMVLLMRWEQNGPWFPPFYWPPVGGAESFRKLRDKLHENGHLFAVYGSGTAYTVKGLINHYSGEEYYRKHHLENAMTRGPKGEKDMVICNSIRRGESFCLTESAGRNIMMEQALILADEKVDYFQMLDQNVGCVCFPCYAKNHHHKPVPGTWQTRAMQSFLHELNDQIAARKSPMILGTECAAAHAYLPYLPFNDLRSNFCYSRGIPVPAYEYVFHAYANNFFGNQCDINKSINPEKSPDNLQFRLAYAFSCGTVMTVTLRDSGEIDWGAAADWSKPAPKQEPLITLIAKFNQLRRKYSEFLIHGEMVKPRHKLVCGKYTLHYTNKDRVPTQHDSIMISAWRSPAGKYAEFCVNYLDREQSFTLDGKSYTLPPLSVLERIE